MGAPKKPDSDPALELFVSTDLSLAAVAERLEGKPGCSLRTLKRRYGPENWKGQRDDHKEQVRRAAIAQLTGGPVVAPVSANTAPAGTTTPPTANQTQGATPGAMPAPAGPAVAPPGSDAARTRADRAAQRATATDLVLEKIRALQAEELAGELQALATSRRTAIAGVQLAISEATNLLAAHRTHRKVEQDGSITVEVDEVDFKAKMAANSMLATAASTMRALGSTNATLQAQIDELTLQIRQLEVATLDAKLKGVMPPEVHEVITVDSKVFNDHLRQRFGGQERQGSQVFPRTTGSGNGPGDSAGATGSSPGGDGSAN